MKKYKEVIMMEKLLWKAAGVVLFFANIFVISLFVVFESLACFILAIFVSALDWLYKEKCPTWIEV
jgi:hypothetical protein